MKPSWFVAISLFVLLAGVSAAQTTFYITANIPFDFQAYGKWMPAGEYELQSLTATRALLLRDLDAKNSVILVPRQSEPSKPGTPVKFVFARTSDNHYLTSVAVPGGLTLDMPLTSTQKQMLRIADRGEQRTVVASTAKPKR